MSSAGFWDDAEVISCYTRADAIEDGTLVDVSEWASNSKGFMGGFTVPVVMTRALWEVVDIESRPKSRRPLGQDTRGRAHDVLWMASLALRGQLLRERKPGAPLAPSYHASFDVILTNGRAKVAHLSLVLDGDGVTVGFPEDF